MTRWLKEPLLHFLLAGGLLFAAYAWLNHGDNDIPRLVHITAAEVNWLSETWTRQWSRAPDEQELRGLVAGYLKEQLLAREARELGLELDDTIVRRRLAQKMEFLIQDAASLIEPDNAELRRLYDSNRERYQSPAWVSFTQLYFRDEGAALQALDELKIRSADELGDSSLLARDYEQADAQAVASVFGSDFAAAVFVLEADRWQGPIASAYGYHLVRVSEHRAAQQRPFEQVRTQVLAEWQRLQQDKAKQQYFAGLLEKYDVVMDEEVASLVGSLTEFVP